MHYRFKKRYLLGLALLLVLGFGMALYGMHSHERHYAWLGLLFMLLPVLTVGVWILKQWIWYWKAVNLQHKKDLAKARRRDEEVSEIRRLVEGM